MTYVHAQLYNMKQKEVSLSVILVYIDVTS